MRTYIIQKCNTLSSRKREIRSPVDRDLNTHPNTDHIHFDMPHSVTAQAPSVDSFYDMHMTLTREVFETCRLITMIWVEEYDTGGVSHGYYNRFTSYFYVPQDTSLSDIFGVQEGEDVYSRLNTQPMREDAESFYRYKTMELEHKIIELEQKARKYEAMNVEIVVDEPVVQEQHFDENIFELEQ